MSADEPLPDFRFSKYFRFSKSIVQMAGQNESAASPEILN